MFGTAKGVAQLCMANAWVEENVPINSARDLTYRMTYVTSTQLSEMATTPSRRAKNRSFRLLCHCAFRNWDDSALSLVHRMKFCTKIAPNSFGKRTHPTQSASIHVKDLFEAPQFSFGRSDCYDPFLEMNSADRGRAQNNYRFNRYPRRRSSFLGDSFGS